MSSSVAYLRLKVNLASDIIFDVTTLVLPDTRNDDDLEALRSRVAELEAVLGERGAEVARVQSDLEAFRITYRQHVGTLHEQLDNLELEIAEAELGELSKQVESGSRDPSQAPTGAKPVPPPRLHLTPFASCFVTSRRLFIPTLPMTMSPEIDVTRSWSRPTGRTPQATRLSFVGFLTRGREVPRRYRGAIVRRCDCGSLVAWRRSKSSWRCSPAIWLP